MKIYPVTDAAFQPYGRVVEGYALTGLLGALKETPISQGVTYVPKEASLHAADGAEALGTALFGGMPFQLGYRIQFMNCQLFQLCLSAFN